MLCYRLTHLCIQYMSKHFGMANTKFKISFRVKCHNPVFNIYSKILMKDEAEQCFNIMITNSSVCDVGCVKVFLGYVTARCNGRYQLLRITYSSSSLQREVVCVSETSTFFAVLHYIVKEYWNKVAPSVVWTPLIWIPAGRHNFLITVAKCLLLKLFKSP